MPRRLTLLRGKSKEEVKRRHHGHERGQSSRGRLSVCPCVHLFLNEVKVGAVGPRLLPGLEVEESSLETRPDGRGCVTFALGWIQ